MVDEKQIDHITALFLCKMFLSKFVRLLLFVQGMGDGV